MDCMILNARVASLKLMRWVIGSHVVSQLRYWLPGTFHSRVTDSRKSMTDKLKVSGVCVVQTPP